MPWTTYEYKELLTMNRNLSEIGTYLLEIHADLKSMNRILSSLCFGTGMAALFTMIIAVLWMIDHAS